MSALPSRLISRAALLICLSAALGADRPDAVTIGGNVSHSQSWTTAELSTDFAKQAQTIQYTSKSGKHSALAVPIMALIDAAGPKFDPKIKNHVLRFDVVVEGRDGYTANFALPELMSDFGDRPVWLALDMDGKPLADRDAPASLIVPADKKPGRWVHGIKTIHIFDTTANVAAASAH
jgi:DMSO/TMAO reductase YedYZ molybdopterin-dependent catalytic subunit